MAKLALIYGMRLLPADEVTELGDAPVKLKNGREARVTMHLLEAAKKRSRSNCGPAWKRFSISTPKSKPYR